MKACFTALILLTDLLIPLALVAANDTDSSDIGPTTLPARPSTDSLATQPAALAPGAPADPAARSVKLASHLIYDESVKLPAVRLLAPADWATYSRIDWRLTPWQPVAATVAVIDPQSWAGVTWSTGTPVVVTPQADLRQTAQAGGALVVAETPTPRDYVASLLLAGYPDVTVGDPEELPQLAADTDPAGGAMAATTQPWAGHTLTRRAVRVPFGYKHNDVEMEAEAYVVLQYITPTNAPGAADAAALSYVLCERAFVLSARRGELEARRPLLVTILGSGHSTLEWNVAAWKLVQAGHRRDIERPIVHKDPTEQLRPLYQHNRRLAARAAASLLPGARILQDPRDPEALLLLPPTHTTAWINDRHEMILSADAAVPAPAPHPWRPLVPVN